MNDENIIELTEGAEIIENEASETFETMGISEELFIQRMDSLENLLMVQLIGLALIAGCLIATLVMRFFRNV